MFNQIRQSNRTMSKGVKASTPLLCLSSSQGDVSPERRTMELVPAQALLLNRPRVGLTGCSECIICEPLTFSRMNVICLYKESVRTAQ